MSHGRARALLHSAQALARLLGALLSGSMSPGPDSSALKDEVMKVVKLIPDWKTFQVAKANNLDDLFTASVSGCETYWRSKVDTTPVTVLPALLFEVKSHLRSSMRHEMAVLQGFAGCEETNKTLALLRKGLDWNELACVVQRGIPLPMMADFRLAVDSETGDWKLITLQEIFDDDKRHTHLATLEMHHSVEEVGDATSVVGNVILVDKKTNAAGKLSKVIDAMVLLFYFGPDVTSIEDPMAQDFLTSVVHAADGEPVCLVLPQPL